MTQTTANEAIALLIGLAQRGEIDPWDVQVIEVIDRYLSELSLGDYTEPGRRDTDLSQSGQAFLWASMLVLLKADTLERLEEIEEPEIEDFVEEDSDTNRATRLPQHLERHLYRRIAAPPPKRRPVTLSELIDQLQQMAAQLGEAPAKSCSKQSRSLSRIQAAKAIAHLAHDENLTDIATGLEVFLSDNWQQLTGGKDWLNLDQLLEWWTASTTASTTVDVLLNGDIASAPSSAVSEAGRGSAQGKPAFLELCASRNMTSEATEPSTADRVGVFWALLLLSAQSKVELFQEEFYQDLKIRTLERQEKAH
ncbi:segregation/condensation protein A [Lyngbya aestuarii]|uniref:segregation/condensation protein A n=1 Tax=Lyngbya aestuarii TaxID=118322 RepID=UPI00403D70C8